MPCTQRRFHHRQHCGPHRRFHPYVAFGRHHPAAHHFFLDGEDHDAAVQEHLASCFHGASSNKARWEETEQAYTVHMDVPGVKAHHVTVEETKGDIEITAIRMNDDNENNEVSKTYQDIFYVRPHTADLANMQALLTDGVLTITVPKKEDEPIDIVPEAGCPPDANNSTDNEFRVSLDLPGVKPSHLKLQSRRCGRDGQTVVHLEATRKIGSRTFQLERKLKIEESSTDMARARAFLYNGVFTLTAPTTAQQSEDMDSDGATGATSTKKSATRTIIVTDGDAVPSIASLHLAGDYDHEEVEDTKVAAANMVETADEEEKDWEEVKTASADEDVMGEEEESQKPASKTDY